MNETKFYNTQGTLNIDVENYCCIANVRAWHKKQEEMKNKINILKEQDNPGEWKLLNLVEKFYIYENNGNSKFSFWLVC